MGGLFILINCFLIVLGSVPPACDLGKPAEDVCDDFCNFRCGFYNSSRGETGKPQRLQVFRLTPANVTGLRNKDSGDARGPTFNLTSHAWGFLCRKLALCAGDVGFVLANKNMSAVCARDPAATGCFLSGQKIYGVFVVEMDGQWGPYLQCNPVHIGGDDPVRKPVWSDDREFVCGQECLSPTAAGCHTIYPTRTENTSDDHFFGSKCFCDGSRRQLVTVGRAAPAFLRGGFGNRSTPASWGPQCQVGYQAIPQGECLAGQVYRTLEAWSFESATAMACEACSDDEACVGWSSRDNRTLELLQGNTSSTEGDCIGAVAVGRWSKGKSWMGVGRMGGHWYSTPAAGECPEGAPLGTGGCTWREVSSSYKNASCVDGKVDASVEAFGAACFGRCGEPLNRTSDCYLNCYRDVLMGNAATNTSKIPDGEVIQPWLQALQLTDPSLGGCPEVSPAACRGVECDLLHPPEQEKTVVV